MSTPAWRPATRSVAYDPMIAKLIAHGDSRDEAFDLLASALAGDRVRGLVTNLPFLRWLVAHPVVRAGEATTRFLEDYPPLSRPPRVAGPWAGGWRPMGGKPNAVAAHVEATARPAEARREQSVVKAPMPGGVLRVLVPRESACRRGSHSSSSRR